MGVRWMGWLWVCAALAACQRSAPPAAAPPAAATQATRANEPPGIAWFDGSVNGAFVVAKRESRPVLLYWGAAWCPFCHTLKAKVFSRPDFMANSKLFLPVYLDGDDPGAQKWGEQFGILGYPTLIVLDSDRHEVLRLGAGRDVAQYAALLDSALEDVQPVDAVLHAAIAGRRLSLNECRRLAYNSWDLDTLSKSEYGLRAEQLLAASAQCPDEALSERAELSIYAAYYASNDESAALKAKKPTLSRRMMNLTDQVDTILGQPELVTETAGALRGLGDEFFQSVRARGGQFAATLRDQFVRVMDAAAADPRYVPADQLGFIDAKLEALKALAGPKAKLPKDVVVEAQMRLDAALAAEQDPNVRAGIVNAALGILEDIGDYPKAYDIAKAEIARSSTPYYFKADLAEIAEDMGHKDEALALLDQGYHESKGAATRFQWGQLYVSGLLRLAPKDAPRIQDTAEQVLDELDGTDRIYTRARVRLEKLDSELKSWNQASEGRHTDVLQALHTRMQQICVKIPDNEPARASCDAFLKSA